MLGRTEINALKDFSEARRKSIPGSSTGSTTCGLIPQHGAFGGEKSCHSASSTDLLPANHAGFNSTRGQNRHSNKDLKKDFLISELGRCGQQQLSAPGHRSERLQQLHSPRAVN